MAMVINIIKIFVVAQQFCIVLGDCIHKLCFFAVAEIAIFI